MPEMKLPTLTIAAAMMTPSLLGFSIVFSAAQPHSPSSSVSGHITSWISSASHSCSIEV